MDLQTRLDTKQVIIGLVGVGISLACFFYTGVYLHDGSIYVGLFLLSALFFGGYAATGKVITSLVVPLIMFGLFILAGVPALKGFDWSSIGRFGFVAAIFIAVYINKKPLP